MSTTDGARTPASRVKLLAKIAAAWLCLVILIALGAFLYFDQKLNPYSLDSRSADWRQMLTDIYRGR